MKRSERQTGTGMYQAAVQRAGGTAPRRGRLHADRAPGGDHDHPDRERRRAADRPAGPGHRQVSEAARILQAALAGARDAAIREQRTQRHPAPARPDVQRRSTRRAARSIACPGLQPHHPDRAGARLLRRAWSVLMHDAADYVRGPAIVPCSIRTSTIGSPTLSARARIRPDGARSVVTTRHGRSQSAHVVVLEYPGRRQDPDQQRGPLVYGRRADGRSPRRNPSTPGLRCQYRAVRERGPAGYDITSDDCRKAPAVQPRVPVPGERSDDNDNGWIDEGWDGVDNNGDGLVDETTCTLNPTIRRMGDRGLAGHRSSTTSLNVNLPTRSSAGPSPTTNAREVSLPYERRDRRDDAGVPTRLSESERSRAPPRPSTCTTGLHRHPGQSRRLRRADHDLLDRRRRSG